MSIIRKHSSERMSKINIHNGTIYFSGQVANDVTVGIKEQTKDCLKKIHYNFLKTLIIALLDLLFL